jgi:lantibiotic leader peptide-processing serine protease
MVHRSLRQSVVASVVAALTLGSFAATGTSATAAGPSEKASYVVVLKEKNRDSGVKAIERAGGTVARVNKLGIARVISTDPAFASRLRSTGAVEAVGNDAFWQLQPLTVTQQPPPVPGPEMAAECAAQYGVAVDVGPDQLSACQWDMRMINASPSGSYGVNQGAGATIAIVDTGVDFTHPDIAPNIDLGLSCSFITAGNPTALPEEIDPTGLACERKSATQDFFGHGTHVAGIAAAAINGIGVAGVAPEATIVSLKVCTGNGFCFTQEVVDALIYAGDKGLDVANFSLFADPFLFNCRNEADQRAIVKAISRATQYATQHGVVVVASAGNEATDLSHPVIDELSPDFPPGAATPREVGNQCIVLPAELPQVATVTAVGPSGILSFYSNFGNTVDVTAPGGSSGQAPNPFGRVLNAWGSEAPPLNTELRRLVTDCAIVGGQEVCALYGWIQGTSMAAPHAAGVAALIRSTYPSLAPMAVIARMQNTAMSMTCEAEQDPLTDTPKRCTGGGGHTNFYGHGLVDALAAGQR